MDLKIIIMMIAAEVPDLSNTWLLQVFLGVAVALVAWALNWRMLARWRQHDLVRDGIIDFLQLGGEVIRIAERWERMNWYQPGVVADAMRVEARGEWQQATNNMDRLFAWEQILGAHGPKPIRDPVSDCYQALAKLVGVFTDFLDKIPGTKLDHITEACYEARSKSFALVEAAVPRSVSWRSMLPWQIIQRRRANAVIETHERIEEAFAGNPDDL